MKVWYGKKTWSEEVLKHIGWKSPKVSRTTLKAHWVDISDATTDNGGNWHLRTLRCSNCSVIYTMYYKFAYCPDCGARMVKK